LFIIWEVQNNNTRKKVQLLHYYKYILKAIFQDVISDKLSFWNYEGRISHLLNYRMLLKDKTTKSRVTGKLRISERSRLAPTILTYSSLCGNKHRRSGVTRSPLTSGTFVFCFQRAHHAYIVILPVHAIKHISFAILRIKSTKKFQSNQLR